MAANNPDTNGDGDGQDPTGTPNRDEGYLFWAGWLGHNGNFIFNTADGNGPFRRIYFTAGCNQLVNILTGGTGGLIPTAPPPAGEEINALLQQVRGLISGAGTLFAAGGPVPSNGRARRHPPGGERLMQKQAPSVGRILIAVGFTLSCFGLILFLWIAFGGPIPLKPESLQDHRLLPGDDHARPRVRRANRRRLRGQGEGRSSWRRPSTGSTGNDTTEATLEIRPEFAPIAEDTKAILRQKTLLGETYIELTPGTEPGGRGGAGLDRRRRQRLRRRGRERRRRSRRAGPSASSRPRTRRRSTRSSTRSTRTRASRSSAGSPAPPTRSRAGAST